MGWPQISTAPKGSWVANRRRSGAQHHRGSASDESLLIWDQQRPTDTSRRAVRVAWLYEAVFPQLVGSLASPTRPQLLLELGRTKALPTTNPVCSLCVVRQQPSRAQIQLRYSIVLVSWDPKTAPARFPRSALPRGYASVPGSWAE